MARALIVGCGCRGRELGSGLAADGWQVRGTGRTDAAVEAIEEAGIEGARADPDSPGTILDLVGDVAVVIWLLGSAAGEPGQLAAIHGPRLERLLEKLVDTPVRGFAYEGVGSVPAEQLAVGGGAVERAGENWRIPVTILDQERERPGWSERTAAAVSGLLGAGGA